MHPAERNARKILTRLVENKQIRPESLAWLTAALDPWHDTPITDVVGLPDRTVGQSVVFSLTQEYSISKVRSPVALPAGNWSFRVATHPILSSVNVTSGLLRGNRFDAAENNYMIVPVQVNYAPDGQSFGSTAVGGLPGNPQGCSIPSSYTKGICKVLGVGIEIINTTSALNKQGLVTAVRSNQAPYAPTTIAYLPGDGSNRLGHASYVTMRQPPISLAEMGSYPQLLQYEAAEGFYAPIVMNPAVAPNDYPNPVGVIMLDNDLSGGISDPAGIVCNGTKLIPTTQPGNTTTALTLQDIPVTYSAMSSTVIFSGLSEQTTCTLRVRFICERFPTDAEPDILVLATPSAPYDPLALEIYSRVVHQLPPGVMFSENPKGEWWSEVLSRIASVASPLLALIPHPAGKVASLAAGAASELLADHSEKKRTRRKRKNQQGAYGAGKKKNKLGEVVQKKNPNTPNTPPLPANPGPRQR